MEEKLLDLLKMANTLDERQDKLYAQVDYCADKTRKLEISIRKKEDYSYIEKCSVMLLNNPIPKLDAIIDIFKQYVGGASNE